MRSSDPGHEVAALFRTDITEWTVIASELETGMASATEHADENGANGMEYSPGHPIGGNSAADSAQTRGGKESHKESTGCVVFRCFRFG